MSGVYPEKVLDRFLSLKNNGTDPEANAVGIAAALECGTYVSVSLSIDPSAKLIRSARFRSNGCGFMVAAADLLCERLAGRSLTEMHGSTDNEFLGLLETELGTRPEHRLHCAATCIDAFRRAFQDLRLRLIGEFTAGEALVCTCFGVSESTIEDAVTTKHALTVDDVGEVCRAGTGCGSCRMIISEIIDSAAGPAD